MLAIATAIKSYSADLFSPSLKTDLALRASMLACQAHTDLAWRDIASSHNHPTARPANTRASVAHHRHADPDFDHRYTKLIDHAHTLQQAAGYANVNLNGGLTGRSRTRPEHQPGSNYLSNGKVA